MDNKIKYGILALIALIIIVVAASSFLGNTADDDPTHIVVTAPGHLGEPEAGFNPLADWGCGHMNFNPLIQSTLLTSDDNGSFINDLATGYNVSSDGLTWTVGVRDDVVFSNGEPLTAKDVAFTFNEATKGASMLDMSNLESATATDDKTVEFKLKTAQSSFVYNLRYVGIVPEKDYDNATYGSNPIGSGPYKLKQWDKGQQAIFEYNDKYYGEKPYFTQITMLFPEEDTAFELVKSGQADVVQAPYTSLNESVEGYQLVDYPSARVQGMAMPYLPDNGTQTDNGHPVGNNVTSDSVIRKALNIGINRQAIIENVYKGHGTVEYTGVDQMPYANEAGKITDNKPDEAKKMLEEAGWKDTDGDGIREKDGQKASFKLYYVSDDQVRQSLATVLSEEAKGLGIDIQLEGADWDVIGENMYSQAVLMQASSDNPYSNTYKQYHTKEAFEEEDFDNVAGYSNPEVDAILEQALGETDVQQANSLWSKAAYTGTGSGFSPAADSPWVWTSNYNFCYFIKDDIDVGTAPKMGQDYMEKILTWTRKNTES